MADLDTIDNLKATIGKRGGLAHQNRFSLVMTTPAAMQNNVANQEITLLCETASFPGRQIETFEYPLLLSRNTVKMPNGYFNEDITFNFILTNDQYVRRLFDEWTNLVIDRETYLLNYDDVFKTDMEIHHLNQKGEATYKMKLLRSFPITINSVELSNASSNDYQRLSVTFTFEDFETIL